MKKNQKRIGLDLDGVILDFTTLKIELAKSHGFKLLPEQTPSSVIGEFLPRAIWKLIQPKLYGDRYAKDIPLIPGAKNGLKHLVESGVRLFLISRRKDPDAAIIALQHHDIWPNIFDKSNSFFVNNPEDKNVRALELGITHYCDDELKIINLLPGVSSCYLMDSHGVLPDSENYIRVHSWPELEGFLTN